MYFLALLGMGISPSEQDCMTVNQFELCRQRVDNIESKGAGS